MSQMPTVVAYIAYEYIFHKILSTVPSHNRNSFLNNLLPLLYMLLSDFSQEQHMHLQIVDHQVTTPLSYVYFKNWCHPMMNATIKVLHDTKSISKY